MSDWGQVYSDNIDAVRALSEQLDEEQAATVVPGPPQWQVHEVIAHLAGESSDLLNDRMEGAPADSWTARQVSERAGRSPASLVEELRSNRDAVAATFADNPSPALAWDAAVHHADIHEALGLGRPPDRMWLPVVTAAAPMMLGDRVDAVSGVPPYEVFRALFSRRSQAQLSAWDTGLDEASLQGIGVFGPREDDQPVPGPQDT